MAGVSLCYEVIPVHRRFSGHALLCEANRCGVASAADCAQSRTGFSRAQRGYPVPIEDFYAAIGETEQQKQGKPSMRAFLCPDSRSTKDCQNGEIGKENLSRLRARDSRHYRLSGIMVLYFATSAIAQEQTSQSPFASIPAVADNELQEVIVTAERRAENLQTTAISATVLSADELVQKGWCSWPTCKGRPRRFRSHSPD